MKKYCNMKGFLSFIVLRLISKGAMSGTAIMQELRKRRGTTPSPGTVYPVMKELCGAGFIRASRKGREKVYELTGKGRKEVASATRKFCRIFYDMKGEFGKP